MATEAAQSTVVGTEGTVEEAGPSTTIVESQAKDEFGDFHIDDRSALHACSQRFTCAMTQRSYAFYSYTASSNFLICCYRPCTADACSIASPADRVFSPPQIFNEQYNPQTSAMSPADRCTPPAHAFSVSAILCCLEMKP